MQVIEAVPMCVYIYIYIYRRNSTSWRSIHTGLKNQAMRKTPFEKPIILTLHACEVVVVGMLVEHFARVRDVPNATHAVD